MAESDAHGASLHGESAALRQAVTELLFFASVGDVFRCKKICANWGIEPKDPSTADYDRRTPLHLAAAEGAHSVVKWLLRDCKVNPNPVDRFNRTPLEDAVLGDHGEVVKLLVERGGKVLGKEGQLLDLADSPLNNRVRVFADLDPDWEIDPSELTMKHKLGEGEFGIVYLAQWYGSPVAVKVLKNNNDLAIGDFRTELHVLQKVHHPNTVQFFGAVTKTSPYMIVTEFMAGGSLADVFKDPKPISLRRAVQIALHCARGCAYLHNRTPQAVIHRDLKPANIMVGGYHYETELQRQMILRQVGAVKIADFGLSKSLKLQRPLPDSVSKESTATTNGTTEERYKLTGETGSYRYMAPEVFRHEPYNAKVDVYAWSMIAFQLFEGFAPFWQLHPVDAARQAALKGLRPSWGENNRYGKKVPPELRLLVEACWSADNDARPAFNEVVERLVAVLETMPPEQPLTASETGIGPSNGGCCSVQ